MPMTERGREMAAELQQFERERERWTPFLMRLMREKANYDHKMTMMSSTVRYQQQLGLEQQRHRFGLEEIRFREQEQRQTRVAEATRKAEQFRRAYGPAIEKLGLRDVWDGDILDEKQFALALRVQEGQQDAETLGAFKKHWAEQVPGAAKGIAAGGSVSEVLSSVREYRAQKALKGPSPEELREEKKVIDEKHESNLKEWHEADRRWIRTARAEAFTQFKEDKEAAEKHLFGGTEAANWTEFWHLWQRYHADTRPVRPVHPATQASAQQAVQQRMAGAQAGAAQLRQAEAAQQGLQPAPDEAVQAAIDANGGRGIAQQDDVERMLNEQGFTLRGTQ